MALSCHFGRLFRHKSPGHFTRCERGKEMMRPASDHTLINSILPVRLLLRLSISGPGADEAGHPLSLPPPKRTKPQRACTKADFRKTPQSAHQSVADFSFHAALAAFCSSSADCMHLRRTSQAFVERKHHRISPVHPTSAAQHESFGSEARWLSMKSCQESFGSTSKTEESTKRKEFENDELDHQYKDAPRSLRLQESGGPQHTLSLFLYHLLKGTSDPGANPRFCINVITVQALESAKRYLGKMFRKEMFGGFHFF